MPLPPPEPSSSWLWVTPPASGASAALREEPFSRLPPATARGGFGSRRCGGRRRGRGSGGRFGFRFSRGRVLFGVGRFEAVGVFHVDEGVVVVVEFVFALGHFAEGGAGRGGDPDRVAAAEFRRGIGAGQADAQGCDDRKAGQRDDQCELVSHSAAPRICESAGHRPRSCPLPTQETRKSYPL